jgi:hypothetical protein
MFKTFLAVMAILGAVIGQIYLCTYTEVSKVICFLIPVVIAFAAGFAASGGKLSGKVGNVIGKDDQDNKVVSLFWGVFGLMLVALEIFTFIALSER